MSSGKLRCVHCGKFEVVPRARICSACHKPQRCWRLLVIVEGTAVLASLATVVGLILSFRQYQDARESARAAAQSAIAASNAAARVDSAVQDAKRAIVDANYALAEATTAVAVVTTTQVALNKLFLSEASDAVAMLDAMNATNSSGALLRNAVMDKYIAIEELVAVRLGAIRAGIPLDVPRIAETNTVAGLASASSVERYNSILYCYAYFFVNDSSWQNADRTQLYRETSKPLFDIALNDRSMANRVAAYRVLFEMALSRSSRPISIKYYRDGTNLFVKVLGEALRPTSTNGSPQ